MVLLYHLTLNKDFIFVYTNWIYVYLLQCTCAYFFPVKDLLPTLKLILKLTVFFINKKIWRCVNKISLNSVNSFPLSDLMWKEFLYLMVMYFVKSALFSTFSILFPFSSYFKTVKHTCCKQGERRKRSK